MVMPSRASRPISSSGSPIRRRSLPSRRPSIGNPGDICECHNQREGVCSYIVQGKKTCPATADRLRSHGSIHPHAPQEHSQRMAGSPAYGSTQKRCCSQPELAHGPSQNSSRALGAVEIRQEEILLPLSASPCCLCARSFQKK